MEHPAARHERRCGKRNVFDMSYDGVIMPACVENCATAAPTTPIVTMNDEAF